MRPLTLAAAAVLTVIVAYAIFYWTGSGEANTQAEHGQTEVSAVQGSTQGLYQPSEIQLPQSHMGNAGADPDSQPRSESPLENSEEMLLLPETAAWDSAQTVTQSSATTENAAAEKKEANYVALEQTATAIAQRIQPAMGRGAVPLRGRAIGARILERLGYAVNGFGEHITPDGAFTVDVKGPDLVVVTGISVDFDNEVQVTLIGPRTVDRRLRRIR
ncbi:MAG: hypothetical protein R3284_10170 [Rubricoccaceae bacterium]|nr:hypothetical protein [Rubricoccaceae bacterium]